MPRWLEVALAVIFALALAAAWYADRRSQWQAGYDRGKHHNLTVIKNLRAELAARQRPGPPPEWYTSIPARPKRVVPAGRSPFGPVAAGRVTHTANGEWMRAADETTQLTAVTAADLTPVAIPDAATLGAMTHAEFMAYLGMDA